MERLKQTKTDIIFVVTIITSDYYKKTVEENLQQFSTFNGDTVSPLKTTEEIAEAIGKAE